MEGQKIPKLPGKLITRSKSKTSVGDRELVNFLENLSKDETGAPVKWKFNKSGIKFAKGIGKKIADASKPSSAVYVDSTIKLARSVLRKHVKKQIISDQSIKYKKQMEMKSSQESTHLTDSPIKRKRGRPKKIVKEKDKLNNHQQHSGSAKSSVEVQPVLRKPGRPRKVEKTSGDNEKPESKNWTQLSKKVFHQSLSGMAVKRALQAKMRCSSEERGDSDRIDSEIETESVDSNVSGSSEFKRHRKRNHHGIKLGPKKLLRSQDSLVTRHAKGVGSAVIKAKRKPRKRTLSGEFELLDESSLRKKMKQNDEVDEMTVNSEKKRGRRPKAVSATKAETESEANENVLQMKDNFSFSSLVAGQENELSSSETVQTFSVKSMKHPSLLRKPEVRNINLKKNSEGVKTLSSSTKSESKNFSVFMKKKPGRPANKSKVVSTSLDKTKKEKDSDVKSDFPCLQQKVSLSMEPKSEKPVRGLQIVGPGGMKFTKKAKCDVKDNSQKNEISTVLKKTEMDRTFCSNVVNEKSSEDDKRASNNLSFDQMSFKTNNDITSSSSLVQDTSVLDTPQSSTLDRKSNSPDPVIDKEHSSSLDLKLSTSDTPINMENNNMKATESGEEETGEMLVVTLVSDFDTSDLKKEKPVESQIENDTSKVDVDESETLVDNVSKHKSTEYTAIVPEDIANKSSDYEIMEICNDSSDKKIDISKDKLSSAEVKEQITEDVISTATEIDEEPKIEKESFLQDTGNRNDQVIERKTQDIEFDICQDSKKNADHSSDSHKTDDTKDKVDQSSALVESKSVSGQESSVCVRNDIKGTDNILDVKIASLQQTCSETESQLETTGKEESVSDVKSDEQLVEKPTVKDGFTECSSSNNEKTSLITHISETKGVDSNVESEKIISTECVSHHDFASLEQKELECLEKTNTDITCEKEDFSVSVPDNTMSLQSKLADIGELERDQETILHEMEGYSRTETDVKRPEDEIAISTLERSVTPNSDEEPANFISELNVNNMDSLSESNQDSISKSTDKGGTGKRQIQLRQKASRSPLEIIAMRQSLEERQYLLEQSQKALKREEKQKKMKEKHKKVAEDDKDKELEKDITKEIPKEVVSDEELEKKVSMDELISTCKPCSVVLIDFVKYLKTTKTSYSVESGSVLEEWETVEDNDSVVSPKDSSEPTASDQENSTAAKLEADEDTDITRKDDADETKINKDTVEKVQEDVKPTKRKRKASARKQVRSVTYSAQLTAEIVSNPMLLYSDETQTTVPPLRLKIKQNIIAKPRIHRQRRGLKFTTKKQHKARKGMSPVKNNPPPAVIDAAIAASEPEHKKQKLNDVSKEGFVGSFVQFIQNKGETSSHKKAFKSQTDSSTSRQNERKAHQGYGTLTGETILPRFRCTCGSCSFVASSKSVIESHIYVHFKNIPFKCCYCNGIFNTRNGASVHMRSAHPGLEAKIEPAESVNEPLYYEELYEHGKSPVRSSAASVTSDKSVVDRSRESVVIKVVLPQSDTGCYYCIYCDFSAANQQEILDHIQNSHDHAAQYTCSICKKVILGSKDDISKHFADAHPNQQLMYTYLPEFYESNKIVNQDKGNIFDRMNDLFSSNDTGNQQKFPEKTSAEADSTTVETDENLAKEQPGKSTMSEERSEMVVESARQQKTCDGQLASLPASELSSQAMHPADQFDRKSPRSTAVPQASTPPTQNDMGLKIVDVVSLRDQIPDEWLAHQEPDQAKLHQQEATPVEKTPSFPTEYSRPVSIIDTVLTGGRLQQRPSINVTQPQMPKSNLSKDTKITNGNFGTTYKCEKCNVHAPVLSAMVEHLRVTHKDIARLFLCPYCRQYEGASEPEIHRHIKQFHHSPDQKSPPVALSSAAKKHLRTIQVPAGDARKIGDKFVIERDIYKCLKCQKHMPSLDYIYDHLEKTHNEVFVYVCPYCKIFKAKKEEVVFHHIRNDHNKNATDIMLSLAIEENLFTRVQSLMKERQKSTQKATQNAPSQALLQSHNQQPPSAKTAEEDVIVVGESRPQTVISQINSCKQVPNMNPFSSNFRPSLPLSVNQQPVRMPFQTSDRPNTYTYQPRTTSSPLNIQSKSSLRKSRPHHIPPQNPFTQRNVGSKEADKNIEAFHQSVPKAVMGSSQTVPPPLIRGPPPLLKVTQEGRPQSQQTVNQMQLQQQIRHMSQIRSNFSASPLGSFSSNSVTMQSGQASVQSMTNTLSGFPRSSRPVLKVPSVTSQLKRQPAALTSRVGNTMQNVIQTSGQSFSNTGRSDGTAPLDLSRPISEKPSSASLQSQVEDDLPPDAFQIFNLRPAGPRMSVQRPLAPVQNVHRAQYQTRMSQPVQRMGVIPSTYRPRFPNNYSGQIIARQPPPYNAIPTQRLSSALTNNSIMNKNVHLHAASLRPAPPQTSSPSPGDSQKSAQNLAVDNQRVFKCPYCPNIVPLSMGEVAPHTEKNHPGHSIVFMKIDKLT